VAFLRNHLVLHRFICREFAYKDLPAMLERVRDVPARFSRSGESEYARALYLNPTLAAVDPNNLKAYELTVDAMQSSLVDDLHELAENVREGDWHQLKLGVILAGAHAYQPLLYVGEGCQVTVRPVALDTNKKTVVEELADLARNGDPCLRSNELYLIRNLTRGRGVSFFDDFGYYPDLIVWLKSANRQHVIFLDPKGLSRFGTREQRKVELHHNIKDIEERIRETEPDLHLHAYVLSVTPPQQIDGGNRSPNDWKNNGVYFLNESDCLKQVIECVLDLPSAVDRNGALGRSGMGRRFPPPGGKAVPS